METRSPAPSESEQRSQCSPKNDSSDVSATTRLDSLPDAPNSSAAPVSYSPTTVYISGMPLRYCTDAVIEKVMSPYGTITRCSVHSQHNPYAFCDFAQPKQAMDAIRAVNGRLLGGQRLVVRHAFRDNSAPSVAGTHIPAVSSIVSHGNRKRQRQQLDSKIEAIKLKLAKKAHHGDVSRS